jgi:hypothetical protein
MPAALRFFVMSSVVACLAEAYAKAGRHLPLLPWYGDGIRNPEKGEPDRLGWERNRTVASE